MKRPISAIALSAATLLALAACTPAAGGGGPAAVTLTWETTGGEATKVEKAAFQDPFTEESGIAFENVTSSTAVTQIQTMVDTGNTVWDVVHTGSFVSARFCGELFEEIDLSAFPDDLFPEGTVNECAKPISKYGSAFAYDSSVYTDGVPTQIEDFFDTDEFPGKRVINATNPRGVLEAALVADGVDPEELFPLDVDRALAKLETIKSDLIFAPSFTAIQQNIVDKQATMTITLTGRLAIINDSGGTLQPVWDFTSWDYDALLIPKGSKHVEEAQEAIEFAMQPEQVIRYAELGGSTPVRTDIDLSSVKFSENHELFNAFLDDRGTVLLQDVEWWAENNASASEAYVAWQVG